ncbi:hypothetical protein [Kineococcus rubinsiae]|uniref:hypothetical protein n=1 Tax=Kineococcus rubinsiae TaxID=2609562 RepID=UPI001431561E|nr:hypothetical protein [Kineococcus rubinsiae]NIZ89828.1 hypothetical protein [Kineococcus rubinsiae]
MPRLITPVRTVLLLGALLGAALSWVASDGLTDDTYITLSYARNVAEHAHWGLTPGMTSNAATSPLNVLLLAGFTVLLRPVAGVDPVLALGVLTTVLCAVAGWCAARAAVRLGVSTAWAGVALVVVLANPFLVSALGLEVVLLATAMAALLATALARRPALYGVVAGAALLARLDMVVFVVLIALTAPGVLRRLHVAVGLCAAVSLPWFAFSWFQLGSAIPDTFVIKTLQHTFGPGRTYLQGLWTHYHPLMTTAVVVGVVPAVLGLLVLLALLVAAAAQGLRRAVTRWRSPEAGPTRRPAAGPLLGLGLGGVVYFGVYSVLGVPPYQWYYVPPMASLSYVAVLGTAVLARGARHRWPVRAWLSLLAPASVVGLALSVPAAALPVPWGYPPVFGNFATPAQYRTIGLQVGKLVGDERVASPGEIGTLAYSCRCEIVDAFSDPAAVQGQIEERTQEAGPVLQALLRANYARRQHLEQQPVQQVMRWTAPGTEPPAGTRWWPTTAGTWQRQDKLMLLPAGS